MKRLIIAAGLLMALALPALVAAAPPAWNLTGTYTINFTCTAGCGGSYINSMTITTSNDLTGAVVGTGSVQGSPGYEWTVTGTVSGSDITLDIEWVSPPGMEAYNPFMLTGSIGSSGGMSGTAVDGLARTFTWVTTQGAAASITPSESPTLTVSASPFQSVQGETATTGVTVPPTNTGGNSSNGTTAPLVAMLISLAFGAIGLAAVAVQRRSVRA